MPPVRVGSARRGRLFLEYLEAPFENLSRIDRCLKLEDRFPGSRRRGAVGGNAREHALDQIAPDPHPFVRRLAKFLAARPVVAQPAHETGHLDIPMCVQSLLQIRMLMFAEQVEEEPDSDDVRARLEGRQGL